MSLETKSPIRLAWERSHFDQLRLTMYMGTFTIPVVFVLPNWRGLIVQSYGMQPCPTWHNQVFSSESELVTTITEWFVANVPNCPPFLTISLSENLNAR